ncbi:MAG: mechanosensitive ion channel family protein [Oscillochloris sp.]|nr:mechanosensitive ion channel family protein [Oscillochloris sp.]
MLGVAAAILFAVALVRFVILRRFRGIAQRSSVFFDDAIVYAAEATRLSILLIPALYCGSTFLELPGVVRLWLRVIAIAFLLLQAAFWGNAIVVAWVERFREQNLANNAGAVSTVRILSFVARVVLYSVLLLLALDNIPGVEITSLIAGLGIGGIAVALAVQNILSDIFASLTITLDKPFVLGDFIIVGDYLGTVEQIGIKTTRLRSLSGEQLIFANSDLLNSRIRNFQRMQERRIVFSVGVLYETPAARLRIIPQILRDAVEAQEQVRFDRAHFRTFADFSLDFEVVYYVLSSDYNLYMDIQQAINLMIFDRFEAEQIGFAYPTQQLYVSGVSNAGGAPNGDGRSQAERSQSM